MLGSTVLFSVFLVNIVISKGTNRPTLQRKAPVLQYFCGVKSTCSPCILEQNCPQNKLLYDNIEICHTICRDETKYVCNHGECQKCQRLTCPTNLKQFSSFRNCIIDCANSTIAPELGLCVDHYRLCSYWANEMNACDQNKSWMTLNCYGSCNGCKGNNLITGEGCIDLDSNCQFLHKNGQCSTNSLFMFWKCPVSCSFCQLNLPPSPIPANKKSIKS